MCCEHHILDSSNFDDARKTCQSFGESWDLAIINFRVEYSYLKDLLRHNCLSERGFWMGYLEEEEKNVQTVFGKPAYWKIKWDRKDVRSAGKCVQLQNERFIHGDCKELAYAICENHNYNDYCQPKPKPPAPSDRYILNFNSSLIWDDAQAACKAHGPKWDLAIINDQAELDRVVRYMNCPEVSMWIGEEDRQGHLTGVDGKPVDFAPWDMHSNVLYPGANDATGAESCIKLRGNLIGDSECTMQWTGTDSIKIVVGGPEN